MGIYFNFDTVNEMNAFLDRFVGPITELDEPIEPEAEDAEIDEDMEESDE